MASATSKYVYFISIIFTAASAITNSQEPPPHYSTIQYQGFNNQGGGGGGSLTPQEQILSDVQQHRFYVPQRQRVPSQVPPFEPPRPEFQNFHPQNHFPYHNYQPNYQPERPKPILLQPTFPEEFQPHQRPAAPTNYQPQLNFQNQNAFQQSFQQNKEPGRFQQNQPPKQINNPAYQQGFQGLDNFVVPEKTKKHQQYLTETVIPKQPEYSATAKPEVRSETPSWILETQPATAYKKQKPLEAITFGTEAYHPSTPAPRIVKLRQRPKSDATDIFIKTDRKKLYDQLVKTEERDTAASKETTPKPVRSTTTVPTSAKPATAEPDEKYIQEQLQKQIQAQLGGKEDIFQTLKITLPGDLSPEQIANLPNIALGDSVAQLPEYSGGISGISGISSIPGLPSSKDGALPESVYLANGQKLKISSLAAKTSKNKNVKTVLIQPTTTTTTPKPPKVLFEELTKNVLPPGADFEIIKQSQDGALENVGPIQNLPQKKVTFVILEEQPDGSVKVQGVRGSENEPTETKGAEVDSIIERLKKGEIKLPPSTKLSKPTLSVTPSESQTSHSYIKQDSKGVTPKRKPTATSPAYATSSPSGTSNSHSGPIFLEDFSRTTQKPAEYTSPHYSSPSSLSTGNFLPTVFPHHDESSNYIPSSTYNPIYSGSSARVPSSTPPPNPTPDLYSFTPKSQSTAYPDEDYYSNHISSTTTTPAPIGSNSPVAILGDTLKANGLYAMARYLRQSGLDMVLNETGPYTLFVPTDKAFRALLVQLGGPDRAEIKFKENPRLLSGLLLHHVIPGAFKLASLLDEMTGVSLAGTQLRVNTYTTQDNEWNDVKVTTINGAKVVKERADITVPQGIAHTVDRVMFPLPVGDIVQTLQADREGRFSRFIQLLQETGVSTMLQGTKTYTVFAPTDGVLTDSELKKILQQRASARTLALRHVAPGTLYSAGMLFYQIRESMSSPNQIQLSKEAGRVKVNNAHVISRNIPATNGVIHAIDNLL